jgi:Ca2+ transporting ATPase
MNNLRQSLSGKTVKKPLKEKEEEEEGEGKSVLATKLTKLAVQIGYLGTLFAVLSFCVLMLRFVIETYGIQNEPFRLKHLSVWVGYLITAITILVVAVPEGLPLAVTLSLAYSVRVGIINIFQII